MTKLSKYTNNVVFDPISGDFTKVSYKIFTPTNFKLRDEGSLNKKFNEQNYLTERFNKRQYFKLHMFGIDDSYYLNKDYKSNIINVYNLKKKRITVFLVDINLESYKKLNLCCNSLIDGTYNPEIVEYDLFTADELEMVLLNSQKHLAKVVKELESNK